MKKYLKLTLASVLALSVLAACGDADDADTEVEDTDGVEETEVDDADDAEETDLEDDAEGEDELDVEEDDAEGEDDLDAEEDDTDE
ncbi:hypothetical protein [Alteribacter aurantiacus]|uniref:hypothetical protein n=1 Tax=Alteribacter aurantiacus TaxID=254410 RepID=UPI00042261F7|nr:hypothetical protein [Alteribacter aurantiacus]